MLLSPGTSHKEKCSTLFLSTDILKLTFLEKTWENDILWLALPLLLATALSIRMRHWVYYTAQRPLSRSLTMYDAWMSQGLSEVDVKRWQYSRQGGRWKYLFFLSTLQLLF